MVSEYKIQVTIFDLYRILGHHCLHAVVNTLLLLLIFYHKGYISVRSTLCLFPAAPSRFALPPLARCLLTPPASLSPLIRDRPP